ncbi:MAG: hypothetical protein IPL62_15005 [Caulobacteraceae bacterium]|nr:hypothetical protein [Caulobacteraceae bacterium]
MLKAMGVGSAFAASLVLRALCRRCGDVHLQFANVALAASVARRGDLWLARVWLLTGRGEMPDNPVVHAVSDPDVAGDSAGRGSSLTSRRRRL